MDDVIIHKLANWSGNEIFLMREDLLPLACGGNKVRIAQKLITDAKRKCADTILAYGNSRSNLCRALAMLCSVEGLRCTTISPCDDDGQRAETINSRIGRLCGANVVVCEKSAGIAEVISRTIRDVECSGGVPYYIFGDIYGKGNEIVLRSAYVEVAESILLWQRDNDLTFDRIVLAVGTGSTYGGLLEGFRRVGSNIKLTGFTIARELVRCKAGVAEFCAYESDICDIALNGGYGKICEEELLFLHGVMREYGLIIDPVYSGKALWGLDRYLKEQRMTGERILFVHTGSLPLAVDQILGGAYG